MPNCSNKSYLYLGSMTCLTLPQLNNLMIPSYRSSANKAFILSIFSNSGLRIDTNFVKNRDPCVFETSVRIELLYSPQNRYFFLRGNITCCCRYFQNK